MEIRKLSLTATIQPFTIAQYLPRERSCSSLLVLEGGKSQEKTSVSIYCLVALGKGVEVGGGGILRTTIEKIVPQLL